METTPSSPLLDLQAISSRLNELEDSHRNCIDDDFDFSEAPSPDSDQLLSDCALQLQSRVNQILSDFSDFSFLGVEDLDAYLLAQLKEELAAAEAETVKVSNEIEVLTRTHMEDSARVESNLEMLKCSLDFVTSKDPERQKEAAHMEWVSYGTDESNLMHENRDHEFEILKLDTQIEESKSILKSMQDFDSIFKRLDAIEQLEEELSGLKGIDFDGTCIKLSLRTFIPKLDDSLCLQKIEDSFESLEVNHEFLIEVDTGTIEMKNVEMFPNDVYIGDIVDSAKSFRKLLSETTSEVRPAMGWFLTKVQDRIIQYTLRQMVVKSANKSRHSFEYLDRDGTIIAHMTQGIDAFIKVSPGWPLLSSPMKLISLNSLEPHSKEISVCFLQEVEKLANSLDVNLRQNLSNYVDAIEKALLDQMNS